MNAGMKPDPLLLEQDAKLSGWLNPVARMQEALDRDELVLYCQPIAAFSGEDRFPMAEVLVRFRAEESSLMPPGEFLPVFEHYRMMPALDRWVVRSVVRHLATGSRIARFSINLSSQTIVRKLLSSLSAERKLRAILRVAEAFGFGVIAEMVEDRDILARLKALGVSHAQGFGIQRPRPLADFAVA